MSTVQGLWRHMWKSDTDTLAVSEVEQCFPSLNRFQATVCKQKFQSFMKIKSVMLWQCSVRLVTRRDCFSYFSISLKILCTGGKKSNHLPICQISGLGVKVLVVPRGFLSSTATNQGCAFSPCASLRWGWLSLMITSLLMQKYLGFWSSLTCNHERA